MAKVYIGLGSNMQSPRQQVTTALHELDQIENTSLVRYSSLYQTKPVGSKDQDDYINAVAVLYSELSPANLLDELHQIENTHQRIRQQRWGPRTLDLDILLYDDIIMTDPDLTLPHKEIVNRLFVLVPLAEIAPDLCMPGFGSVSELILRVDEPLPEKLL